MSIQLRKKQLSKGRQSLYLDIFHNGQRYYEFLKIYLIDGDKMNKEKKELADKIRANREMELQGYDYNYVPRFKREADFIAYFKTFLDNYKNKDIRLVRACYLYFIKFIEANQINYLPVKNITENLCKEFKEFLTKNLNGETPYNYFTKFKKLIKQLYRERLIIKDFTEDIKNTKQTGLKKNILNVLEIQSLAGAKCGNNEVKRAFLFSLNTGVRYCDIIKLKWSNIDNNRLKFTQSKTEHTSTNAIVNIDLNPNAIKILGEKGAPDKFIFNLPSYTACLKNLSLWCKKAGIEKRITWHCARHSFAVILLGDAKADIKTVASLLGHSGLNHVAIYTRAIDELKKKAVNNIPDINF